jgi:hypothetical protein
MSTKQFDRRLVFAANSSFSWIFECVSIFNSGDRSSIREKLAPHMHGNACDLINPGLVLAACYIYFVYPKETAIEHVNLSQLDISKFTLSSPITPSNLVRRLRNSLSHGRFEIDDKGIFTFFDQQKSGLVDFEAKIHFGSLGEFVQEFAEVALGIPTRA